MKLSTQINRIKKSIAKCEDYQERADRGEFKKGTNKHIFITMSKRICDLQEHLYKLEGIRMRRKYAK